LVKQLWILFILDSIFNVDKDNNDLVKRRRSGSPYVDPNDLFSIPSVKKEIRNMKPALDKLEGSKNDEKAETGQ